MGSSHSRSWRSGGVLFSLKPTYQGTPHTRGHSSFSRCFPSTPGLRCPHATYCASLCRWPLLPRPQSGQRPPRTVFHQDGDYAAFVKALADVCREVPLRPLAYCLMPNHFHLVLWPEGDTDLSRGMQWLLTTHVRRSHQHYHSSGHVW
ncbi:MAG: transposase, partial [Planctomycetes bacterium]|nr:transposase [Planctomycetota bacterium]